MRCFNIKMHFVFDFLPTIHAMAGWKIDSAICKSNEKFISLSILVSDYLGTTRVYSLLLPVCKDYLNFNIEYCCT